MHIFNSANFYMVQVHVHDFKYFSPKKKAVLDTSIRIGLLGLVSNVTDGFFSVLATET